MAIFNEALELDSPEDRAAYLDRACKGDAALRARVEELLAVHDRAGDFLESPAPAPDLTAELAGPAEAVGTVIGPYRLMELLGEGGMGVVYVAEQREPVRRKVALKVIKPGMDSRQVVARFEAERQALAMMDHPNIAKVLDAGTTDGGRPYFVMELVRGLPITEYCDREGLPIRERLELFVLVCRAVQHAHQKGVIHRDLKPSNLLVTLHDGVPVPKVIDFGVAKATGQSLTDKTLYTGFAQLIGTPLYMSPEQVEMSGLDVDTRSDIYSLGALLYELLTGATPFDAETLKKAAFDEMRRIIREQEPQRPSLRLSSLGATLTDVSARRSSDPRRLNRAVRGELDWIALKALDKDRRRRYVTANDLAADVMRHLTGQVVEACPPSAWRRFSKYARRNRGALTTAGLLALTLMVGTAISVWQAVRATTAERRTAEALTVAQDQRRLAERHLFDARLQQVAQILERGQVERAQEILEVLRPGPGGPDLRGFAWHYLRRRARLDIAVFQGHRAGITAVALSDDGRVLASGDEHGVILVWDAATGQTRARLAGHSWRVSLLAISGDGLRLVSVAREAEGPNIRNELCYWDIASGRQIDFAVLETMVREVMFTPSGRWLVMASDPHRDGVADIDLIDPESGLGRSAPIRGRRVHTAPGFAMAGAHVAAVPIDGRGLTVYNAESLEALWSTSGADLDVAWPSLSANGDLDVLTAHARVDGQLQARTWRAATGFGVCRGPLADGELIDCLGLARGAWVVSLYSPSTIILNDLTRRPLPPRRLELPEPETQVIRWATLSRQGSKLAVSTQHVSGGPGPVTVWETTSGRLLGTYAGRQHHTARPLFAPDGRTLFLSGGNSVQRWRLGPPEDTPPDALAGHADEAWAAAFAPDGRVLATGSDDTDDPQTIKLWDPATGRLIRGWHAGPGTVSSLAFHPEGKVLASTHLDAEGTVRLWDPATGQALQPLEGHRGKVRSVAYSPDGRWLATGGDDGTIRLRDGRTGRAIGTLAGHEGKVRQVAFRLDGRVLASASNDHTVRLWDVATGEPIRVRTGSDPFVAVDFAPDGVTLAALDEAGMVHIWDTASGELLRRFHDEDGTARCLAFAPDGRTLATSGGSRVVRLWDPATGQDQLGLREHAGQVNALAFSPDGRLLVSCDHTGAVRLWRADDPNGTADPRADGTRK
jgi:WD40 repeat protein/serine/threonine protein kinase